MLSRGRFLFLTISLAACAAPTTQRPEIDGIAAKAERLEQTKLALKQGLDQQTRLTLVMSRLNAAAAEFCKGKTRYISGFATHQIGNAKIDQIEAFNALYPEHGNRLNVVAVIPGMGADKGGLKIGDQIIAVNGETLPSDTTAAARLLGERIDREDPSILTILRGGKQMSVNLSVEPACRIPPMLVTKNELNAYTEGTAVYVFRGMMDFIKTDEELALVLGHELGHVVRHHIDAKKHNATVGQVFGVLIGAAVAATTGVNAMDSFAQLGAGIGAGRYSVDFEAEADYVGLYIMARAGYPIDRAADFWRRMAIANPNAITMTTDHPATADRFVALEATTREIKVKQASGQPLIPNEAKREDPSPSAPSVIQQQ